MLPLSGYLSHCLSRAHRFCILQHRRVQCVRRVYGFGFRHCIGMHDFNMARERVTLYDWSNFDQNRRYSKNSVILRLRQNQFNWYAITLILVRYLTVVGEIKKTSQILSKAQLSTSAWRRESRAVARARNIRKAISDLLYKYPVDLARCWLLHNPTWNYIRAWDRMLDERVAKPKPQQILFYFCDQLLN